MEQIMVDLKNVFMENNIEPKKAIVILDKLKEELVIKYDKSP